ncbi:Clp protease N-terminal domain-containing protein [Agromyces humatus]|uniref:Clp R domain-containing protein n=1 Tax=Agromyces humatus TaxID=279573 RepID=A0ABP4WWD1_9MICO|nr:Clp protease N-terminal domain-containing protein [Agromyces humatus]
MSEQLHDDLGVTLKTVITASIEEAIRRGAAKVEAEHLLLSIAASGDAAAQALADAGLDYPAIEAALQDERARALRAAGIEPVSDERLHATRNSRPVWGASIRDALRRGDFKAHRNRGSAERERLAVADALIGVLRADLGTVPRAIEYAGVDRAALIARLERF